MADLAARIASSSGDAAALLALAIELAQENAGLNARAAALEEAERIRKADQADRKRRQRNKGPVTSRDIPGQDGTERDVAGPSPLPPVSLLSPTPPNNPSFPPPPTDTPPAVRVVKAKKPGLPAAGPSWVTEGSAWWLENVGDIEPPRFGKALKRIVGLFGWPAVFPDLQKWVSERKSIDKPSKAEWYAGEASARLTAEPPPLWDPVRKELTAYGERMTRPATVAR